MRVLSGSLIYRLVVHTHLYNLAQKWSLGHKWMLRNCILQMNTLDKNMHTIHAGMCVYNYSMFVCVYIFKGTSNYF